jgi:hypothetical protein
MNGIDKWKQACAEMLGPVKFRDTGPGPIALRTATMDLGIAICGALTSPGQVRTTREIAAFAGCTHQAITDIEKKAMRKIRRRLMDTPDLRDALRCYRP